MEALSSLIFLLKPLFLVDYAVLKSLIIRTIIISPYKIVSPALIVLGAVSSALVVLEVVSSALIILGAVSLTLIILGAVSSALIILGVLSYKVLIKAGRS